LRLLISSRYPVQISQGLGSRHANRLKGAIATSSDQGAELVKQSLGIPLDMAFADLMEQPGFVSHRLEAIGIIGHEHLRSHASRNRFNPRFESLRILGCELING
jgi:hypothetical protein